MTAKTRKRQNELSSETVRTTADFGNSMEHAVPAGPEYEQALNDALGSTPISIRMSNKLVEELKALARKNGLGYQPYMRMILTQHVNEHNAAGNKSR